ncbi:MAG: hypothetical protein LBF22_01390 [Deltaproteobacteria bacterium]|nr:hypothetical protein [Deltaproteobacteria bacterium]
MKIIPFVPATLEVKKAQNPKPFSSQSQKNFAETLENVKTNTPSPWEIVGQENQKALSGASANDLNEALRLLETVVSQIRKSPSQALQKVHLLDDILYFSKV